MTIRNTSYSAVLTSLLLLAACSGGGGSSDDSSPSGGEDFSSGGGTLERTVIDNYVNEVILPFYSNLDAAARNLVNSVKQLAAGPTDERLASARSAWVATRIPWENSETALFGPVDFYGFDPALDTWPVNRTDLEAVLTGGAALTPESVANLDNALKGFHTIEFLLFGEGGEKTAGDFTARELEYLASTTEQLNSITTLLLRSWTEGLEGQQPYAKNVTLAGQGSIEYPTERSAIEEMVRGMIAICDEVANGKIADPFDQRNPNIVESQFSYNSIADFANNIRGVRIALDKAVLAFVAAKDPGLATRLLAEVDQAIAAIEQIPEPFRNAILDGSNDSVIRNAQKEIRDVQTLLETSVLPLVLQ